jgi:hypothetical protein
MLGADWELRNYGGGAPTPFIGLRGELERWALKPAKPFNGRRQCILIPSISLGRGGDGAPEPVTGEEGATAFCLAQRHGRRASGAVAGRPAAAATALAQGRRRVASWAWWAKKASWAKACCWKKKENRMGCLVGWAKYWKRNGNLFLNIWQLKWIDSK